jgi:hypothetical protein
MWWIWGTSTIRAKFQVERQNVQKLVTFTGYSHFVFGISFSTDFGRFIRDWRVRIGSASCVLFALFRAMLNSKP